MKHSDVCGVNFQEDDTMTEDCLDVEQRSAKQSLDKFQQFTSTASSATFPMQLFSRPLQRKLNSLSKCNLLDVHGQNLAMKSALSVAERAVADLTISFQSYQHMTVNLWTAIRSYGCQFLGPAMQEEVLKLILLALEDGSALSRKVLVMFVVKRLQPQFPQASKTAVGHVVQLLYRASCFNVMKRDEESSLMQLKEEFRNYDSLRCQHDTQIVNMSLEFGLRIGPEQLSCLLYGDNSHKSHMQSIIDKLFRQQTFAQSVDDMLAVLQKTGNPLGLCEKLKPDLESLIAFQRSSASQTTPTSWSDLDLCLKAVQKVVCCLAEALQQKQLSRSNPANFKHDSKFQNNIPPVALNSSGESLFGASSSECIYQRILEASEAADDKVSDLTTALRSFNVSCHEPPQMTTSVFAHSENGSYNVSSSPFSSGVPVTHQIGFAPCDSVPFLLSSSLLLPAPTMLNILSNTTAPEPVLSSQVMLSPYNQLPAAPSFEHLWYPTASNCSFGSL